MFGRPDLSSEERDVFLIVEAYAGAGNVDIARRRIERYRAEYPSGPLHARVDAIAAQLAL